MIPVKVVSARCNVDTKSVVGVAFLVVWSDAETYRGLGEGLVSPEGTVEVPVFAAPFC